MELIVFTVAVLELVLAGQYKIGKNILQINISLHRFLYKYFVESVEFKESIRVFRACLNTFGLGL